MGFNVGDKVTHVHTPTRQGTVSEVKEGADGPEYVVDWDTTEGDEEVANAGVPEGNANPPVNLTPETHLVKADGES